MKLYCLKARQSSASNNLDSVDKFVKALKFIDSKKGEPSIAASAELKRKYLLLRVSFDFPAFNVQADVLKDMAVSSEQFPT